MSADVQGILLYDKPLGLTSAAAVAQLKRLYDARKVGHTGSLDPLATGALVICFGEATKFGSHLLDADKSYRVVARLGERTPSGDQETEVIECRDLPAISFTEMSAALAEFPRTYQQMPPMHSALKQDGKPLYQYARAGVTRERQSRLVNLHRMQLMAWSPPDLTFEVSCSKGTYIRVLAQDIAQTMNTIGHLTHLRRLSVDPFDTEPLKTWDELERFDARQRQSCLLSVDAALQHLSRLDLSAAETARFSRGLGLDKTDFAPGTVRIYAAEGRFLGLGEMQTEGRLVPRRLVAYPDG